MKLDAAANEILNNITQIRYFQSAYPASTQRSIFAAPIPSSASQEISTTPVPLVPSDTDAAADITDLTTLTDISTPAWYEASFSPEAGYYLLSYRGPEVPWQSIFKTGVDRSGEFVSSFLFFLFQFHHLIIRYNSLSPPSKW